MRNNQDQIAREWAVEYLDNLPEFGAVWAAELVEKAKTAAEYIMATTKPETMDDMIWEEDKYHLAGATTQRDGDVVMMFLDGSWDGKESLICCDKGAYYPSALTPNGKKYKIVELPDHPTHLDSVQGFWDAPEGTVVGTDDGLPWWKGGGIWVCGDGSGRRTSNEMFEEEGSVEVLRWDWGGEE